MLSITLKLKYLNGYQLEYMNEFFINVSNIQLFLAYTCLQDTINSDKSGTEYRVHG